MGTGKTTKAIEHLKQYLASRHGQNIEVYVPRHDLADEWEQGLDGINARVVHVYPRTGGKWDESSRSYAHPICATGLITSGTWRQTVIVFMAMPV